MSCHHLQSEHVEVEGMDMSEVEIMNMVEEQDHLTNHRLGEKDMNMVGIHMVEVEVWIRWGGALPPDEPPTRCGGYGYEG
jgi:hypothetical protein